MKTEAKAQINSPEMGAPPQIRLSFVFLRTGQQKFFHTVLLMLLACLSWANINAGHKAPAAPTSQLRVSTDFAGGSAEILLVDAETGQIHIQPSLAWEQGWPCWWYLRIDGLTVGQEVALQVSANPRPFRPMSTLSSGWSQPDRAAISTDNMHWTQTPERERLEGEKSVYRFAAPAKQVWLAWGPPFLPSHAEELLARIAKTTADSERFELARTRGGRPVPAIRLGGGTNQQPAKYGVWVQARQHAWESGSSWVARGFVEWVASDDPEAIELRRQATIWFVPIMDVDRVSIGAGGKESVPQDHNRDWSDHPYYPAVAAAQKRILDADLAGRFDLFLDLHNPDPVKRQPYFYGPFGMGELPAISKRNYRRWHTIAEQSIKDPLPLMPQYLFATYITDEEEKGRMSAEWVRRHTAEHIMATTLETVWNTPHSTQAGYQTVGRQLGQAIASYLAEDPRRGVAD